MKRIAQIYEHQTSCRKNIQEYSYQKLGLRQLKTHIETSEVSGETTIKTQQKK